MNAHLAVDFDHVSGPQFAALAPFHLTIDRNQFVFHHHLRFTTRGRVASGFQQLSKSITSERSSNVSSCMSIGKTNRIDSDIMRYAASKMSSALGLL